jgi:hypothetical protein
MVPVTPRTARARHRAAGVVVVLVLTCGCSEPPGDLATQIQLADVKTGWFDSGIVDAKNKLVPTVSFQLRNNGPGRLSSLQLNAVFRRKGEAEEWGSAFSRVIGSDGLDAGGTTPPIVFRSQLGYTGEQPRTEMLAHSEFVDARVEIFAKRGSAQWVKVGEFDIKRQLLTR